MNIGVHVSLNSGFLSVCPAVGLLSGMAVLFPVFLRNLHTVLGFSGGSDGKVSAYNVGDMGSIPGLGKSPGEGIGNALQYSWLENSMDRGAW